MGHGIRLLVVDGLNLVRRVYAAQPGDDGPVRAEAGKVASGQSLERALREAAPTHAVVVFEGSEPTWRHRLFSGYKAGHRPMPEALREALPGYRDAFAALGVTSFELPGYEADDLVATLAAKCAAAGGAARILSTDKIFLQLLSESITVRDHFAPRDLDRAWVVERFGVDPERLLDLLALAGDSTNGIPGVPGVGLKTGARLLATYPSLEAVLTAATTEGDEAQELTPKLAERLAAHADDARLARRLVELRTELELGINLRTLRYP